MKLIGHFIQLIQGFSVFCKKSIEHALINVNNIFYTSFLSDFVPNNKFANKNIFQDKNTPIYWDKNRLHILNIK